MRQEEQVPLRNSQNAPLKNSSLSKQKCRCSGHFNTEMFSKLKIFWGYFHFRTFYSKNRYYAFPHLKATIFLLNRYSFQCWFHGRNYNYRIRARVGKLRYSCDIRFHAVSAKNAFLRRKKFLSLPYNIIGCKPYVAKWLKTRVFGQIKLELP